MIPYFSITHISFGSIAIQVWGFFAAIGFVLALFLSLRRADERKADKEIIWDVMTIGLLGMIAGGRILYFFSYRGDNIDALLDTHGGFSVAGGAIAAAAMAYAYLKYKKQDMRKILDILTPGAAVALISVRIGCFLLDEHVGKITGLPWAMEFTDGSFRHPVALYHILFLIFILIITQRLEKIRMKDGMLFLDFCILYAFFSFFADFFRCVDLNICDPRFRGLTGSQWIMLTLLISYPGLRKIIERRSV